MKKNLKLVLVLFLPLIFLECNTKVDSDEEIISVLYKNISAAENENLDLYLSTIDLDSPVYSETRTIIINLFKNYDLKYELKKVVVLNKSSDEARVGFIQKTTKLNGPSFRDNELSGIHILKKNNGSWKIYNTETNNLNYL